MGKRIKDLSRAETDGYLAVDNALNGTGKMNTSVIFDNFAITFVPNSTNAIAGLPYLYQGVLYTAKEDYSGPWDSDKFERATLEGATTLRFISNPEYLFAMVDANEVILAGFKRDGSLYWQKGLPMHLFSEFIEKFSEIDAALAEKVDKVLGKGLIDSVAGDARYHQSISGYLKVLFDGESKVIEAIKANGQHEFFCKPVFRAGVDWSKENLNDLEKALKENGFVGGTGDWSEKGSLEIEKPRCAIVNFSGINAMPTTKTDDMDCFVEFWDMNGNYFKKPAIINAQGTSSLAFVKKNVSIDLLNEDDSSFSLKFGDWVTQDSFHLKAYYTDYFRGMGAVGYNIFKLIADDIPYNKNRTWKKGLVHETRDYAVGYNVTSENALKIDDGALCFPQGFPCIVFLNGAFYGIFAWQLKKHRDNYMMKKNNNKHIHLDGEIGDDFFNGTIDWTKFEIRNPKGLKDMNGNDYDGDNPQEIADGPVKTAIVNLSNRYSEISAGVDTEAKKALFEQYFDVNNIIDYIIFCELTYNVDGLRKNWQWTTWDGVKWFVNPYDLDGIMGATPEGQNTYLPRNTHINVTAWHSPTIFIYTYYSTELKARYAHLRSKGILTQEKFIDKLDEWVKAVGNDNYKKEWEKWPESPCNRNVVVNENYWEIKVDENGDPVMSSSNSSPYNATTSYVVDDEVTYNPSSYKDLYYTLKCTQNCRGQAPITSVGMRDNIWRVYNWIKQTFINMDALYEYSET